MTATARNPFWPSYEADLRRRAIIARQLVDRAPAATEMSPEPPVVVATPPPPPPPPPPIKAGKVAGYIRRVASAHNLPLEKVKDPSCRKALFVAARAEIAWVCIWRFGLSLKATARRMGFADHSSIIYLRDRVDGALMAAYGVCGRDAAHLHRRQVRAAIQSRYCAAARRQSHRSNQAYRKGNVRA